MSRQKYNMFYGADVILFERAKVLRSNMTRAERLLFDQISKGQLGVRFKAQHPIANYIVDFYCHKAKLVVELDGDLHFNEEAQLLDDIRTKELQKLDLRVVRFTNEEVFKDMEYVIGTIRSCILHI